MGAQEGLGLSGMWLLVGALWAETLPLAQRLSRPRPLGPRLMLGRFAGQELALLTCGVGPDAAERRTAWALERVQASRVLSFGTCGALSDSLRPGDVLSPSWVCEPEGAPVPLHPLGELELGLVTVRRAVATPRGRLKMARTGAIACEMEAAGVQRAASRAGARSSALKVVSDRAGADEGELLQRRDPIAMMRFFRLAWVLVRDRLIPALEQSLQKESLQEQSRRD